MATRTRVGAFIVTLLLGCLVSAVPAGPVSPASAADTSRSLEFSLDGGDTWSSVVPTSLFPAAFRVVPGDVLESTLSVRLTRDAPTVVAVSITNAEVDNPLFDSALTVAGRDEDGNGLAPMRLGAVEGCEPVIPTRILEPGETAPIELVVAISSELTRQQAVRARASFDLAIGLTDPGAPTTADGCPVDPSLVPGFPDTTPGGTTPSAGPGSIAFTGIDSIGPTLAIAAGAAAIGTLVLAFGRRRRKDGDAR